MATALITGARGQVGDAVLGAAEGCEVIVHAGAIAHDSAGTPADIVATNVLGTWHVLLAAERWRVSKVIYFARHVLGWSPSRSCPTVA